MTDDSTTEERVSVDAMTFWTSKSVIEWLMANTNESDIIVVKEVTDGEENPNPVLFDFTIGAVEVTEFMDILHQHIEIDTGDPKTHAGQG